MTRSAIAAPQADIVATADTSTGIVTAVATIPVPPARVFQALASSEILDWWVRPGVFDTRHWQGDVRPGGRWEADGVGKAGPYALEGEFVEIDAPRRLVHTWKPKGAPVPPMTVVYELEPVAGGARIKLTHSGFPAAEVCENTAAGWKTSFEKLSELMANT